MKKQFDWLEVLLSRSYQSSRVSWKEGRKEGRKEETCLGAFSSSSPPLLSLFSPSSLPLLFPNAYSTLTLLVTLTQTRKQQLLIMSTLHPVVYVVITGIVIGTVALYKYTKKKPRPGERNESVQQTTEQRRRLEEYNQRRRRLNAIHNATNRRIPNGSANANSSYQAVAQRSGHLTDYELEQIAIRHGFQAASDALDRQELADQTRRARRSDGETIVGEAVAIDMPEPPAYSADDEPPKYEDIVNEASSLTTNETGNASTSVSISVSVSASASTSTSTIQPESQP
ncbi:hypothetical protein GQ42DRAFT_180747 [Ramicandelaber brevisporus]|nr:hypothetical protein GQ42DRAFT_180747 [Ramicandelaber brevisporus]